VRELVNCLEQAIVNAGLEPILFTKHLPLPIRIRIKTAVMGGETQTTNPGAPLKEIIPDNQTLQEYRNRVCANAEQQYLINLIQSCNGKIQNAIQTSGLSQSRLYALLKKYNITH
jgi:two-component system NtrC family response regulator